MHAKEVKIFVYREVHISFEVGFVRGGNGVFWVILKTAHHLELGYYPI